jgi:hypothetical protein
MKRVQKIPFYFAYFELPEENLPRLERLTPEAKLQLLEAAGVLTKYKLAILYAPCFKQRGDRAVLPLVELIDLKDVHFPPDRPCHPPESRVLNNSGALPDLFPRTWRNYEGMSEKALLRTWPTWTLHALNFNDNGASGATAASGETAANGANGANGAGALQPALPPKTQFLK